VHSGIVHVRIFGTVKCTVLVDYKITNPQHDVGIGWEKTLAGGAPHGASRERAGKKVLNLGTFSDSFSSVALF
jgi:hypothetical protein